VRTPLQNNALANLHRTIEDLASEARQQQYKAAVPFVHVPEELVQQWTGHAERLNEAEWFRTLFSADQLDAVRQFGSALNSALLALGEPLDDVPGILARPEWRVLCRAAHVLLEQLPSPGTGRRP
jgi:hypothetical protein